MIQVYIYLVMWPLLWMYDTNVHIFGDVATPVDV
jgi:hypothetical protein